MKFAVEINGQRVIEGKEYDAVRRIFERAAKRRTAMREKAAKRKALTEVAPIAGDQVWERRAEEWRTRFAEAAPTLAVGDDTPHVPLNPALSPNHAHLRQVAAYAGVRGHAPGTAVTLADYLGHADPGRLMVPGHAVNILSPASKVDGSD